MAAKPWRWQYSTSFFSQRGLVWATNHKSSDTGVAFENRSGLSIGSWHHLASLPRRTRATVVRGTKSIWSASQSVSDDTAFEKLAPPRQRPGALSPVAVPTVLCPNFVAACEDFSAAQRSVGLAVAQVSQPAVSPISKSAWRGRSHGRRVGKPAIRQTWQSALPCCASAALRDRDASRAWKPGTAINLGPIHPGSSQAQAMSITFESFPAPGLISQRENPAPRSMVSSSDCV